MRLLHSLAELEAAPPGPTVLSVGNFDGVHRAHQRLLAAVVAEARARGAMPAVLTFEPHPLRILRPDSAPPLITPLPEKIRLLAACGVELLVVLPFSRDLSLLSPREFVGDILVTRLGARAVHEGQGFRFGHRQAGDSAALAELAAEFGFALTVHAPVVVRGQVVSSSRIRTLVAAGAVARAGRLLGRPFAVRQSVVSGRGVGRRLTVPTMNLGPYSELLPAQGVYVTRTSVAGRRFDSVTNVGTRPTFADAPPALAVESHLLDFAPLALQPDPSPFDQAPMEIAFLHRLREERRFASPALLREQILADVARARRYFARRARRQCPPE